MPTASGLSHVRSAACACAVLAASLLAPTGAQAQEGPPPPPVGTGGHPVSLVARGLATPSQIAFAHGRIFVGSPGDEQTGKGAGVFQIRRGRVSRMSRTPVIGLVYSRGTLFGSSENKVIAWSRWRGRAFGQRRVIFSRSRKLLPFLETIAVGPDGRLYMGSSDAGDKGPIGTPLSGRVFAMRRDGTGLQELARGLRQPFGIAFLSGSRDPYVGNESDESSPTPPDFIVQARPGSAFGFRAGCQWRSASAPACRGKTAPVLRLPAHASPTGMVGRGHTIYAAFFGGTTKNGPEIRALGFGRSRQIVQSGAPLVGVGLRGHVLYFGDVTGAIWRVRIA